MKIIRPPVKYHGGKYYLCRWITQQFPVHDVYVEPFGGAASVLLNKPRAKKEVYNDSEYSIYNLMLMLRDESERLLSLLKTVKYEKENYERMRGIYKSSEFDELDPLQQAVITYSVRRMSRGGLCGTFCWSSRIYGDGVPGELHGWLTSLEQLPDVAERLQGVEILNEDATNLLKNFDSPTTLYYLDPPYPKKTRVFQNAYRKEMNEEDHRRLAESANGLSGTVAISSYPSVLYEELFGAWRRLEKPIVNHSSQEKKKETKTEVLWIKSTCQTDEAQFAPDVCVQHPSEPSSCHLEEPHSVPPGPSIEVV